MEAFSSLTVNQVAFLQALAGSSARYLVVGGFAVRYHQCIRHTEDLDIFLERSEPSVDALLSALTRLHAGDLRNVREHLLRQETKITWNGVDLFTTMRKLAFEYLFNGRIEVAYNDFHVPVISLHHLKLAKRIALEDPERSERWAIDQEDLVCLEKRCSEAV